MLGPSARETITSLGAHLPRGERDEDVLGVVGRHADQDPGAVDAGLLEDVLFGRVAGHDREAAGFSRSPMRSCD